MPFKSKAQRRLFWAKEQRGEIPKKTVLEWEHSTKNKKKLPEHVAKTAYAEGVRRALCKVGFLEDVDPEDIPTERLKNIKRKQLQLLYQLNNTSGLPVGGLITNEHVID